MAMGEKSGALVVFQDKKIRRIWHQNEWWFVIEDVIAALIESRDPKQYISKLRQRDEELSKGWVQIVHILSVPTPGGSQRMNCVNTEGAFRVIQSVPSPKAEPFKLWLAKVGYERVQEIENPELAQQRMKDLYRAKGYSNEWIEKRVRGIAVRQELTDEWGKRGVQGRDYAVLTNEISKAAFGKTVEEYKRFKGLDKQPLRDHMTGLELIFTMLGEASTTAIERAKEPRTLDEHKGVAHDGGEVAGNARKDLEQKTKKSVVSDENYLTATERQKRIGRRR